MVISSLLPTPNSFVGSFNIGFCPCKTINNLKNALRCPAVMLGDPSTRVFLLLNLCIDFPSTISCDDDAFAVTKKFLLHFANLLLLGRVKKSQSESRPDFHSSWNCVRIRSKKEARFSRLAVFAKTHEWQANLHGIILARGLILRT